MSPTIRAWIGQAAGLFVLVAVLGCQPPDEPRQGPPNGGAGGPALELPSATYGLELQEEDYAAARASFRTTVFRKWRAPQPWSPLRVPDGATEVTYDSGKLRLTAW